MAALDVRQRLAHNLRRLREAKGWSQEKFAFEANVHRTYVSDIERGARNPTIVVVERLALPLGPLADMLGRRPVVFVGLGITFAGMGLSALASDIWQLMAWRTCTGIGMGALVAVAYPLVAEYSNQNSRPMTLALMVLSFPLGGVLGGSAASLLMPEFGWRSAFIPGLVIPIAVAVLCFRWLPEPLVSRIAYHSVLHSNTLEMPHHIRKAGCERLLRHSPLSWTILQPAMYVQTALGFFDAEAGTLTPPFHAAQARRGARSPTTMRHLYIDDRDDGTPGRGFARRWAQYRNAWQQLD